MEELFLVRLAQHARLDGVCAIEAALANGIGKVGQDVFIKVEADEQGGRPLGPTGSRSQEALLVDSKPVLPGDVLHLSHLDSLIDLLPVIEIEADRIVNLRCFEVRERLNDVRDRVPPPPTSPRSEGRKCASPRSWGCPRRLEDCGPRGDARFGFPWPQGIFTPP